ncbi:hypothetical protein HHX47_DHR7000414, partial [Lentinula edodes]
MVQQLNAKSNIMHQYKFIVVQSYVGKYVLLLLVNRAIHT